MAIPPGVLEHPGIQQALAGVDVDSTPFVEYENLTQWEAMKEDLSCAESPAGISPATYVICNWNGRVQ